MSLFASSITNSITLFAVLFVLFLVCFFAIPEKTTAQFRIKQAACMLIFILMIVLSHRLFVVEEGGLEKDAASAIEQFTSYDEVISHSTSTYDITVHDTGDAKEIRFYDKAAAHDGLRRFTAYTRYYRVLKDLSYGRVPLDETSFAHERD
ncbi:hypothetical protein ACTNCI_07615 [Mitsuokella jalaludinii]|uniref:hypothetical protein n=1 Tax=Mitsuokella jalaludinii TaxID=187979 RepID=UPI003F8B1C80